METQNQTEQVQETQEQEQEVQTQAQGKKPKAVKKQPVDPAKYEQYVTLKFLVLDGAQLKDTAQKELEQLEKEILASSGKLPKKTVTASFGSRYIKLVKDVPVPAEIYDFIKATGKETYYFG